MPDTYSNSGLILQQNGSNSSIWGDLTNLNMTMIDQAIDGSIIIPLSTVSYTLLIADGSLSEGRNEFIEFTGSLGSPVTISLSPVNIQKVGWISNQTGQPMTLNNGSGSALSVANGVCVPYACDGAGNCTNLLGNISSDTVNTNNLVVNTSAALPTGTAVTIAGVNLPTYISALIPALTTLAGSLVVSNIASVAVTGGNWAIFTFGNQAGTRVRIGIGGGLIAPGGQIGLPVGFATDGSSSLLIPSIGSFNTSAGSMVAVSTAINATTQVATCPILSSTSGTPGANIAWSGVCWLTGY